MDYIQPLSSSTWDKSPGLIFGMDDEIGMEASGTVQADFSFENYPICGIGEICG